MRAAYAQLRDHARERKIPFAISFEDFQKFARKSRYLDRRGPFAMCLTVDRKNNLRGYEPGNIQPLTRSANSVKRSKQDMMRMRCGMSWAR